MLMHGTYSIMNIGPICQVLSRRGQNLRISTYVNAITGTMLRQRFGAGSRPDSHLAWRHLRGFSKPIIAFGLHWTSRVL